jgi:phosphoribosyl-AMP cyclohydrolase / phosphoribosyl-ATP pyrophosphohydrolase
MNLDGVRFDAEGLVPVVVLDTATGTVAMLAWANRDALERTIASRQSTFWSRSRKAIWVKGETSGNRMDIVSVSADCDGDAVLYEARVPPATRAGRAVSSSFSTGRHRSRGSRSISRLSSRS